MRVYIQDARKASTENEKAQRLADAIKLFETLDEQLSGGDELPKDWGFKMVTVKDQYHWYPR